MQDHGSFPPITERKRTYLGSLLQKHIFKKNFNLTKFYYQLILSLEFDQRLACKLQNYKVDKEEAEKYHVCNQN